MRIFLIMIISLMMFSCFEEPINEKCNHENEVFNHFLNKCVIQLCTDPADCEEGCYYSQPENELQCKFNR